MGLEFRLIERTPEDQSRRGAQLFCACISWMAILACMLNPKERNQPAGGLKLVKHGMKKEIITPIDAPVAFTVRAAAPPLPHRIDDAELVDIGCTGYDLGIGLHQVMQSPGFSLGQDGFDGEGGIG